MIACLPMYDWPELRAETDAFWAGLAAGLRKAGFDAPEGLSRSGDLWSLWRSADLVLGQTCGLPYAARLRGDVALIGAPAYDLPGCPAGMYRSEIVVRANDPAERLEDCRGRRFAYNMRESQSGWAALDAVSPLRGFAGDLVKSGAHRASAIAVAEGRADFAALDAVSWRLAMAHEPAARGLRVLASTPATPGLPLITAKRPAAERERLAAAVEAVIPDLPDTLKQALFLTGFKRWSEADYASLAAGWPRNA